jgi:hypothetical protein
MAMPGGKVQVRPGRIAPVAAGAVPAAAPAVAGEATFATR